MSHAQMQRVERMRKLMLLITKAIEDDREVDEGALIGYFSEESGASVRKVREYLDVLQARNHIKREGGKIKLGKKNAK